MGRGAWWATVLRIMKSRTWLKQLSTQHRYLQGGPIIGVLQWRESLLGDMQMLLSSFSDLSVGRRRSFEMDFMAGYLWYKAGSSDQKHDSVGPGIQKRIQLPEPNCPIRFKWRVRVICCWVIWSIFFWGLALGKNWGFGWSHCEGAGAHTKPGMYSLLELLLMRWHYYIKEALLPGYLAQIFTRSMMIPW